MHSGEDDKTELDLFNEFKEATGGIIYQNVPVTITKFNIDKLIEEDKKKHGDDYNKYPDIVLRKEENGKGFYYWGKYYKSLSALSKKEKYWLRREIHFNKIIDIVKYYPYIISIMCGEKLDNGKVREHIEISTESFVERSRREDYEYGCDPSFLEYYDMALQDELIRVVKEYEEKN